MSNIELLAFDVLKSIDHIEREHEWDIAAATIHSVLKLIHKHGYSTDNLSELLTAEYDRWNKLDAERFFE